MKKINMKKTVSTVLIAAMLASGAGSAFAISKEECESVSNCIVYDGGPIDFDYKEIFVPNDKRAEFDEQMNIAGQTILKHITSWNLSNKALLIGSIISLIPSFKFLVKDLHKLQNKLGITKNTQELKTKKSRLKIVKGQDEDYDKLKKEIDVLKSEIALKDSGVIKNQLLKSMAKGGIIFAITYIVNLIIGKKEFPQIMENIKKESRSIDILYCKSSEDGTFFHFKGK